LEESERGIQSQIVFPVPIPESSPADGVCRNNEAFPRSNEFIRSDGVSPARKRITRYPRSNEFIRSDAVSPARKRITRHPRSNDLFVLMRSRQRGNE
jgi:hypothetical protein